MNLKYLNIIIFRYHPTLLTYIQYCYTIEFFGFLWFILVKYNFSYVFYIFSQTYNIKSLFKKKLQLENESEVLCQ